MSYTITEPQSGVVVFDTLGSPGHVYRFMGKMAANGQLIARPAAYAAGPTATTGLAASAAGIAPSIVGTDLAGTIVVTNSANGVAGAKVIVSFGEIYDNKPVVVVSPITATSASAQPFVTASVNSFTISTNVVPVASGIEAWSYLVLGS